MKPEKGYNKRSGGRQGGHLSQESKNKMSATKRANPHKKTLKEKQQRLQTLMYRYGTTKVLGRTSEENRKQRSNRQKGIHNSSWAGYFVCPYGVFSTTSKAAQLLHTTVDLLHNRMRLVPELYYQTKKEAPEKEIDIVLSPLKRIRGAKGIILCREQILKLHNQS